MEPTAPTQLPHAPTSALGDVLASGSLHSLYQPVVELVGGRVVGYEALVRGPLGTALETPGQLFSAARSAGRLVELDAACRESGLAGAASADLAAPLTLFLNAEPEALDGTWAAPRRLPGEHASQPRVIVEITERALAARPAEMLAGVARIRALGWGIAIDDVGTNMHSLALMPLLRPDVVKLDLRLSHARPDAETAAIVHAVNAETERTGAAVVAEGIETEKHLAAALAMGAKYGQGWLFGRPAPLSHRPAAPDRMPPLPVRSTHAVGATPCQIVHPHRDVRRAPKELLLAMSRHIEEQVLAMGEAAVVLTAFQRAEHFSTGAQLRYEHIAEKAAFVGAIGERLDVRPTERMRGASISPDDPMAQEWNVVAIGPHYAAALTARDCGDKGRERERRFDFAVTYDRDLVARAAISMMAFVAPSADR